MPRDCSPPRSAHRRDQSALRLDVGLPEEVCLLGQHDLDNYAFPLAVRLTKGLGLRIVSVWSTKATATRSFIRCEQAAPAPPPGGRGFRATVRTTASASTTAFKQQISDQLTDATELPPGPVALELAFAVGPSATGSTCGSRRSTRLTTFSGGHRRTATGIRAMGASPNSVSTARSTRPSARRLQSPSPPGRLRSWRAATGPQTLSLDMTPSPRNAESAPSPGALTCAPTVRDGRQSKTAAGGSGAPRVRT